MSDEKKINLLYMKGVEGNSFYLNEYRLAGPKPWGGGTVLWERNCSVDDLRRALGKELLAELSGAPVEGEGK